MSFSTLRANKRIYLDHNATTPVAESVRDQLVSWVEHWGNPSSIHQSGRGPKALMRESRDKIAKALGANPLELIFTSGGSESNNLALKGVFEAMKKNEQFGRSPRHRYLFSDVEHPSVRRAAEYLVEQGAEVAFIPVLRDGSIDLARYEELLDDRVALVSVMLANNETGNLFPVKEMAARAHAYGALFHTDAVQALGKIPVDLSELGVDLASFSGHKFYALKGSGLLFCRRGLSIESQIHGGGQERHRRGGTENLLAIASLGFMCGFKDQIASRANEVECLRNRMEARILEEIRGVHLTGAESPRLPTTSSLVIDGVDGETLLMNLDMKGFSVSTGAACSSGSPEPSPVLLAMGLTRHEAQSSLRVGLGWGTTLAEIDAFVETLKVVIAHVRSLQSRGRFEDANKEKDQLNRSPNTHQNSAKKTEDQNVSL
jgi:cysteine desulfurase